ncbi:MAG: hypothetical protein AAF567_04860 [Actinomycetota bacterium]
MTTAFELAESIVEEVANGALGKIGEEIGSSLISIFLGEKDGLEEVEDRLDEVEKNQQLILAGLAALGNRTDHDSMASNLQAAYSAIDGFADQLRTAARNLASGTTGKADLDQFYRDINAGSTGVPAQLDIVNDLFVGKTLTADRDGFVETVWKGGLLSKDKPSMTEILESARMLFAGALHYQRLALSMWVAAEKRAGNPVDERIGEIADNIRAQCDYQNDNLPTFLRVLALTPSEGIKIERLLWGEEVVCWYDVDWKKGQRGLGIIEDPSDEGGQHPPHHFDGFCIAALNGGSHNVIWPEAKGRAHDVFQFWKKRTLWAEPIWSLGFDDRDRPKGVESQEWTIRQSDGAFGEMTIRNGANGPWSFEVRQAIYDTPSMGEGKRRYYDRDLHEGVVRNDPTDDEGVRFTFEFSDDVVNSLPPAFPSPDRIVDEDIADQDLS